MKNKKKPCLTLPPNKPGDIGPFTAPMMPHFDNQAFNPFFSNIRQNMELSHGPIRERFPIRLPRGCQVDAAGRIILQERRSQQKPRCVAGVSDIDKDASALRGPNWLARAVREDSGPKTLAEMYEALERKEQQRLQNIMFHHTKHTHATDFPLSIVAGLEMGTLNRYTNIWPFGTYLLLTLSMPVHPLIRLRFVYRIQPRADKAASQWINRLY